MDGLPEDVAASLVRSLGAYLRASPAPDLPPRLRRLKGFRDAALLRQHRADVLSLLDEEVDRDLIVQWLDEGRPPLDRRATELLRLAAARPEGWAEELGGASAGAGVKEPADAPPDRAAGKEALAREKAKVHKAREELRRVKEEMDAALTAERARLAVLQRRLDDEVARGDTAEKDRAAGEKAAGVAAERGERELRRARRDLAKAVERADALAAEVKALKAELASLRAASAPAGKSPGGRKRAVRPRPVPEVPAEPEGPRRPLKAPKGRLAEAPETLIAWLGVPGVIVVLDGYNVTKAEGGFASLALERQRERLIDGANRVVSRYGGTGYIVFDGSDVAPGLVHTKRAPLRVVYSAPGQIADDCIIDLIESLPPYPVVLVTNDRELQDRARSLGCTIARSEQFLALLP